MNPSLFRIVASLLLSWTTLLLGSPGSALARPRSTDVHRRDASAQEVLHSLGIMLLEQVRLPGAKYGWVTGTKPMGAGPYAILATGRAHISAKQLFMRISEVHGNSTAGELRRLAATHLGSTNPAQSPAWRAQMDWLQTRIRGPLAEVQRVFVTVYTADGRTPLSITALGYSTR